MSTHNLCLEQKYEDYRTFFYLKIFLFFFCLVVKFQYIRIGVFS